VQLIDWRIAELTGTRLVPAGPRFGLVETVAIVEDLRNQAASADRHVAEVTGLDPAGDSASTVIVDRQEWVRANVESFRILTDPVIATVLEKRASDGLGPLVETIGSRAAGAEVGALLSYLATRVLGQFELIGPARVEGEENAAGRLTLVAPNIVAAERALEVDPRDFRLWVCLHEVTHRTQFAAAPWLHEHVQQLLTEYLVASDLDAGTMLRRLRQAASGLRGGWEGTPGSLVELVQTPEQSAILDRITGLMSLLEGHADVVMDTVGPSVIPSVATIRKRFDKRRREAKPLGRIVRRLLGVELKLRQYAEGAAFVRAVVDKVGMAGLNAVWSNPGQLPTAAEIREPERWLARTGVPPAIHA
jgi:coenzyme F420 biosynthesis associated uncharacterized protein